MQPDPAITSLFHAECHRRGAADVQRSAKAHIVTIDSSAHLG